MEGNGVFARFPFLCPIDDNLIVCLYYQIVKHMRSARINNGRAAIVASLPIMAYMSSMIPYYSVQKPCFKCVFRNGALVFNDNVYEERRV